MSEADLREGLRAAVHDEPPLQFDPDALIEKAEHVRKRRRALVAVGVATVALTASVLALPGMVNRPDGFDAATVLTTTAAPAATAAEGTPAAEPPTTRLSDRALLVSMRLTDQLTKVVPGVEDVRADLGDTGNEGTTAYVSGIVQFVDRLGPSSITFQVSAPPRTVTPKDFCAGATCAGSRLLGDGSRVEFATTSDAEHKMVTISVGHFRKDGTVVQVSGYNYDPAGIGAQRDAISVTEDQLTALATDPGVTLS